MKILITDLKTSTSVVVGPIILRGGNYTPSPEEYFAEAWKIACEDELINPENKANYSFQFA